MSELPPGRTYSAAGQRVLDAYARTPEDRAEYVHRNLIPTNNLGFHMLVVDHGPERGIGAVYYSSLSIRTCELLEAVHLREPELWQEALAARAMRTATRARYSEILSTQGLDHPETSAIGDQLDVANWREDELMTLVFDALDQGQLTPEEALDLCG
jgi:hypothetical protein